MHSSQWFAFSTQSSLLLYFYVQFAAFAYYVIDHLISWCWASRLDVVYVLKSIPEIGLVWFLKKNSSFSI